MGRSHGKVTWAGHMGRSHGKVTWAGSKERKNNKGDNKIYIMKQKRRVMYCVHVITGME